YLEQVNILGDSDSIATLGVDVSSEGTSINGDSNLLYNAAVIQEASVDNVVRVGGDTYSEALLYQAEILTADVEQPDHGGAGLASEAVVFLADGMLTNGDNDLETVNLNQVPDEICVDPMATMVA
ncbi:MAG: type I secretion protein ATPase, partial [Pseudomonadota bacterium]|nr:type I secretion protein ATPase [Pseudomonadota bacterium]